MTTRRFVAVSTVMFLRESNRSTALKTVSMYLRAAKTEAEEAGESTDGMANSVSELRDEILALTGKRVDIQIDDGTFKSTYQILKELSEVWDDLADVSQANILEMIGGKRNSNIVAAIVENFSVAEDALETSAESAGSALAENEKVLESIQGKINIMKASFEAFSSSFISSDFTKGVVEFGTTLLNLLSKIVNVVNAFGGLRTILLSVVSAIAIANPMWIAHAAVMLKNAAVSALTGALSAVKNGVMMIWYALPAAIAGWKAYAAGTMTASTAMKLSIPIIGFVLAAITALVGGLSFYNNKAEEARQKTLDAASAAADATETTQGAVQDLLDQAAAIDAGTSSAEDFINTQDEMIKKLGITRTKLKQLTDEYGNYSDAVLAAASESLGSKFYDLEAGVRAAKDELLGAANSSAFSEFFTSNTDSNKIKGSIFSISDKSRKELDALLNEIVQAGYTVGSTYYYANTMGVSTSIPTVDYTISFSADMNTPDGIIKAHDKLQELLDLVASYGGEFGNTESSIYGSIYSQYSAISDAVTTYSDAAADLNNNLAQQYIYSAMIGKELPTTQEGFKEFRNTIIDSASKNAYWVGGTTAMKNAIDDILSRDISFAQFYQKSADEANNAGNAAGHTSVALTDLAESLASLKSAYSALEKAQEEMASGSGLSIDTIQALADETEDYLDYLYEENGLIKLNIDAWKERANLEMQGDISALEDEIDRLQKQREVLENNLKATEELVVYDKMSNDSKQATLKTLKRLLDENTAAITANQEKLGIYSSLYNSITGSLDAYSAALQNFTNISNAITSVSDSLTTVADLQETIANGFTISLEKALEFAKVYPEILNGATVAADGQIALNEGIINAFIEGKEAELKAQIDTEVAKLEADKAVLAAKMEFSKAQLELAKSVGTGEGQISKEVAEYRVNAGNAVAQALIEAGIDEATAYQLACATMAQNSEEFNRVAAEVCTDIQGNFNQAAYDAAQAIYTNMQNSKLSIASVAEQAHETAKAIAGIASGIVQGSSSVNGGGAGGSSESKGNISVHSGSFEGTEYTYEAKTVSLEDYITDLELDISNYSKAISQIDGQIAALKALRNTSLDKFSTSNKSSKSSKDSKDNEPTWFEKEYALHKHLLAMDAENVEDYLDWLNSAYQRAYKEGIIDLDEYYKYQEEVYTELHNLFKDYLNDVEHEISMRGNYEGESSKILTLYEKLMSDVEREIASAREQGLDDTDDYIQELQSKWQGYYDSVKDIRDKATENAKDALDELVEYRIDMIKQDADKEKDALDKKLDYLKEFYDKQKDLLQDAHDEEKYLKEQSEKRKSVSDIKSELAMLEYDDSAWAQKRKLELQVELSDAEDDLASFEDDRALDLALDALDDAYNEQEAQIKAEMEALDDVLNDPEALYNKALADIKTNTGDLYEEMLEYNRRHGTGNDEDVDSVYENAYKALLEYKDVYGEDYKGVVLTNDTNYKPDNGSWDIENISGTNPANQTPGGDTPTNEPTKSPTESYPYGKASETTGYIKQGSKGAAVKAIQYALNQIGYGNSGTKSVDGVFGSGTKSAVMAFQKAMGIPQDGVVGDKTRAKFKTKGYASGTNNATAGLHQVDELGAEYLFLSQDGNKYRFFDDGDKVLNAGATNFLYDFANSGGEILEKIIKGAFGGGLFDNIRPIITNNEINMGDIIVQGNAEPQTVSEIRRAQRDNLSNMLKSLNQLNK